MTCRVGIRCLALVVKLPDWLTTAHTGHTLHDPSPANDSPGEFQSKHLTKTSAMICSEKWEKKIIFLEERLGRCVWAAGIVRFT